MKKSSPLLVACSIFELFAFAESFKVLSRNIVGKFPSPLVKASVFDPFGFEREQSASRVHVSVLVSSFAVSQLSPQSVLATDFFDPSQFQPVCPASDGVYQVLKSTANTLVGRENVDEYGPLIASVLLRIRLELCVLESFLYEAVIPFVSKKGLSWVLPLHETVETFLAGTIFAVASNFILLSSTKIVAVLFIYADTLTGMPSRAIGNGLKKISSKQSAPDIVGSVLKVYGDILGTTRNIVEQTDSFVGRYLVLSTSAYIAFKFAHYKFFNDIIPF